MFFYDYPILGKEKELPLYLINMGLQECQDHIIRKEGYPCSQILFCTKGSGTLIIDKKKTIISPYTAIFLPAFYPHEYFSNEKVWDIHWVVPGGSGLEAIFQGFNLKSPGIFKLQDSKKLENIFFSMHEALHSDSLFGNYRASGYLYDFLIEFYRIISSKNQCISFNPTIQKAVDYINCNFTRQITMEDLCDVCRVSKQHLCLLFRTTLHARPMEYITKRRLQAAKELLTVSQLTIESIAEETGFCTASYFCKMFKRYEGMTPLNFKKML